MHTSGLAVLGAMVLALFPGTGSTAIGAEAGSSGAHPLSGYEIIGLGRGHYNRLQLPVTIDGVKGILIVDSGASHTVLSAAKYGFMLKNGVKLPPNIPAIAHPNGVSAPVVMAKDVHIGNVAISGVAFPLVPQHYLYDQQMLYAENSGRQYDGFFGENLLRHYNAIIDCARCGLYLNTDPGRKLDLANALTRGGWTRIPMSDLKLDFTVPCTLGGRPFRLVVDTGSPFTIFDRSLVNGAQIEQRDLPMKEGVLGYVPKDVAVVMTNTLQIGDYVARNVQLTSRESLRETFAAADASTPGSPILGFLGGDVLAHNGALIDVGNHALYLKETEAAGAAASH
jgi:predicted aspartyl protease